MLTTPEKPIQNGQNHDWNPSTKRKSLTPSIPEDPRENNGHSSSTDEDDDESADDDDNNRTDGVSDDPVSKNLLQMAPLSSISEVTLTSTTSELL